MYKASVGVLKFTFYFNYWRSIVDGLFANEKYDVLFRMSVIRLIICAMPVLQGTHLPQDWA